MNSLFSILLLALASILGGLTKSAGWLLDGIASFLPEPTYGAGRPRSSKWPAVKAAHLAKHPECAVCGKRRNVTAHHVQPYWLRPELELDPENLLTMCNGDGAMRCHFAIGHCGDWTDYNPKVIEHSAMLRAVVLTREMRKEAA